MSWYDDLVKSLERHEGLSLKPYRDTQGILTIGYGLNIDEGITQAEAEWLLKNRCLGAIQTCRAVIKNYDALSEARKMAFANMAYNLGAPRLAGFKNMLEAIAEGDFKKASADMLDSLWAKQVGARATELAAIVDKG